MVSSLFFKYYLLSDECHERRDSPQHASSLMSKCHLGLSAHVLVHMAGPRPLEHVTVCVPMPLKIVNFSLLSEVFYFMTTQLTKQIRIKPAHLVWCGWVKSSEENSTWARGRFIGIVEKYPTRAHSNVNWGYPPLCFSKTDQCSCAHTIEFNIQISKCAYKAVCLHHTDMDSKKEFLAKRSRCINSSSVIIKGEDRIIQSSIWPRLFFFGILCSTHTCTPSLDRNVAVLWGCCAKSQLKLTAKLQTSLLGFQIINGK